MAVRNLNNWISAYMEFTRETESPDAYHFWTACSLISSSTRRNVCLDMNQFTIFPNMFIFLVGPSGGRKTVATEIGISIAREAGLRTYSGKITAAALIKELSESPIPQTSGSIINLTSPLILYSPELGVFLGTDAYHSGVIADLTDLYDCPKEWNKKTISRGAEVISAPFINFIGATTTQTLKDVVPPGAVGQGFTSRIMFIWGGGRRKKVPIPIWSEAYSMLRANLVHDLNRIAQISGKFSFSPEGLITYQQAYLTSPEPEEEFEDERLRGYASRKFTHALKLSMILSLADGDDLIITDRHINNALEALKWMEGGFSNVFAGHGNSDTSQDVVRIYDQIRVASARKPGFITHSEIIRRNYAHLDSAHIQSVIELLRSANAITMDVGINTVTKQAESTYKIKDSKFIINGSKLIPRKLKDYE